MKSLVRKSPAKASLLAYFAFAALATLTTFSTEGCVQASEDGAASNAVLDSLRLDSLRGLTGVWMLTTSYHAYTENGSTEKDTIVYDTSDVYMRSFYVIHGSALFWVSYQDPGEEVDPSTNVYLTQLRQIDSLRWVAGSRDTLRIVKDSNRLVLTYHQEESYFDGYDSNSYEETSRLEAVAYSRTFPPPQWFEPAPSDSEPNDTRNQAVTLSANGKLTSGTLTEGDVDWYAFQATAGQGYQIETRGNTDTFLGLYGSGLVPLTEDDDSGDGSNALVGWVCPASGTYYVRLNGYDEFTSGAYKILITKFDTGLLLKKAAGSHRGDIPDLLRPPKRR